MMTNKHKITHGNIIIIHMDELAPSMAIIPKTNFQVLKIGDIFKKITKLHEQFPNCNFQHTSLLFFEDKYRLHLHRHRNMTLTNWFYHHAIPKDENNNYIFYIGEIPNKRKNQSKKKISSKPTKSTKNVTRNHKIRNKT